MAQENKEGEIRRYYQALYRAWGAQHWWPAETAFEVIVGAYLTQNTAWTNVECALSNLRSARLLNLEGLRRVRLARLEKLIRPSGYFRQKAQRLKTFVKFLDAKYLGSLDLMFFQPTGKLREELLQLNGVGPETADSILLYAGNHPVFVVDTYTRRILARHGILAEKSDYQEIRELFERALAPLPRKGDQLPGSAAYSKSGSREPSSDEPGSHKPGSSHSPSAMSTAARTPLAQIYNETHSLIVGVGKFHCGKSQPKCDGCPLQPFLPTLK